MFSPRLFAAFLAGAALAPRPAHALSSDDRAHWGLVREWQDLQGNRDGIWENEDQPAGKRPFWRGQPEAPSQKEMTAWRAWRDAELARQGVTHAGTTGNEVIEGHALATMARYGRSASDFGDGVLQAGGHDIYWQSWDAAGPAKAVTVIVPGYTESTSDWMQVAEAMNRAGSKVYVFDPPGQGESGGRRGDAESPDEWLAAYRAVLAKAQAENPDLKVIVMGHSTGGGVVADDMHDRVLGHVHTKGPDGLVLSSPYLDLRPNVINTMSGVLSNLPGANRLQLPPIIKLSDDQLGAERLKQWAEATGAKQVLHFVKTMSEMTDRHAEWLTHASGIEIPLAIVQGKDDNVTNPAASRQLVANTPGATFTEVDTGSHDLEYDPAGTAALLQQWQNVLNQTVLQPPCM